MLRKRAIAVALTALLSPQVFGLGLGTLKTTSALNEPFDGRIDIVGATATDFDSLSVQLADGRQFDRAGVERAAVLLNLKFEVVSSESGSDYVRITTKDPVREPFLNFLLELNWANGRMVREYTILLDPPTYDRNRVRAPAPLAAPTTPPSAAVGTSTPAASPIAAPSTATAPVAAPAGTTGPVTANDTAWGLALTHRPDQSISVHRMMLALLRANPEAFIQENVNQLRRGAILRIPSANEIAGISQSEAVAEIQRQHQLWQDYRQGVASAPTAPVAAEPSADSAEDLLGDAGTEPAESKTPDDARLELAAPEDGEAIKTPGGEAGGSADEALAKEDLDAKAQENSDLKAKLQEADQIIDLLQRQVQIKDEELAALQARLGGESAAPDASTDAAPADTAVTPTPPASEAEAAPPVTSEETAPVTEAAPTPEPPVTPAPPVTSEPVPAKPEPVVQAPEPPASGWQASLNNLLPEHLRSAVPGGALTIFGIAGTFVALLLVGLSKALSGRGDKAIVATKPRAATAAAAPTAPAAAAAPAADAMVATREDLTAFDSSKVDPEQFQRTMEGTKEQFAAAPPAAPEEDPLEEVNVYLAYERFDQAEELVRNVIAKYPNEPKYKLRLLEIYYSASNQPAYEQAARELHDEVGENSPLWESAVAMWNEMSPNRALFAPAAAAAATVAAASLSDTAANAFVDITADEGSSATMTLPTGGDDMLASTQVGLTNEYGSAAEVDFDLSDSLALDAETAPVLDITDGGREAANDMLDLTAQSDADEGEMLDLTAGLDLADTHEDGVFDISGDELMAGTVAADPLDLLDVTKTSHSGLPSDEHILDVTTPRAEAAEASTINAVADALDQEFDISDTVAPPPKPAGDADEVSLDFDIGGLDAGGVAAAAEDASLDDFDLTLDADTDAQLELGDAGDLTADLDLQDSNSLDFDIAEPSAASSESDVEFDLALQDTTDFENLAIDDTLELPKSNSARAGMMPVDAASESLEDLTRSMEASIAGLDLDDDRDSVLDIALEPEDADGLDIDFGLDDDMALNELDTLALDPEELRQAADAIADKTVAIPRDPDTEFQSALDETDTKLNLAKAYIELGDSEGARTILQEVVADGSDAQQDEARKLLQQLT